VIHAQETLAGFLHQILMEVNTSSCTGKILGIVLNGYNWW